MKWVALEDDAYTRHPFIPENVEENKIAVTCWSEQCKTNPGCLVYIGGYTTQLYREYSKPL